MSNLKQKITERKSFVTYEIHILSTNQYVKMRPYTVREEKQYMIAESSKDVSVLFQTIKDIIANCSFNVLDPETLTDADIQFIMLQLKAKSKDDKAMLKITCPKCKKSFNFVADITKVNFISEKEHKLEYQIEDMVFYMQDPSLSTLAQLSNNAKELSVSEKIDLFLRLISECIVRVAFPDDLIDFTLEKENDKLEFLYSIDSNEIEKLKSFLDTLPHFEYNIKCNCPNCQHPINENIKGLDGFFFS